MKKIFSPIANGFIVPNLLSLLVLGFTKHSAINGPEVIFWTEFIVLPLLMGIISAWFWRHEDMGSRKLSLYSIYNVFIAILLSCFFLQEGVICLIIVAPLLMCFIIGGAYAGRAIFKKNMSLFKNE